MSKPINKNRIKITILVICFVQMATNGLSPAISDISAAFPNASASTVQLLMSVPGIFVVILSFITAGLTAKFSKKFLIGVGLVCLLLTGVLGVLFHGSLQILFAWSCVMGLGMGLVIALTASLISDYFDGKEKANLMGLQTSAGNIGSMIMTAVGGVLTAVAWHLDYLVYFIALPGLLLLLFFIPSGSPSAKTEEGKPEAADTNPDTKTSGGGAMNLLKSPRVWMYVIFSFLILFLFNAGPTNLSMYVSEFEIGTTVVSGTAASVFLLGGTLSGIAFGPVARKLGVCTVPVGFALAAVGFSIIVLQPSIVCLYAGSLIAGMSISMVSPQALMQISAQCTTPQESALASALVFAGANIGTFLTPMITNIAQAVSGSDSTRYRFLVAIVLAIVVTVITLILTLADRRKMKKAAA